VVFLGLVQFSTTLFPARTAVRSVTRSGSFREGDCGAPGIPQPLSRKATWNPAKAIPVSSFRFIGTRSKAMSALGTNLIRLSVSGGACPSVMTLFY